MIYPEDKFHKVWEFLITVMIFITCTITPYTLAFPEVYTEKYYIFDMIMNVIFVIDMFICFISAHYDAEFKIVDDFKEIAT